MTPREVDELWFVDFLVLIDGIKARWKSREDGLEKGGVWIA